MNHMEKSVGKLASILMVSLGPHLFASSETTNSFFKFVQDQSQRQYLQVPHKVLALYYGWFMGGKWNRIDAKTRQVLTSVRDPEKHQYDSHDPDIVDWQIDQAKAHGITGFVLSWWGTGPEAAIHEQSTQLLIERAEKKNFEVSILWEQAPGEGRHRVERAIAELSYALKRYGKSKAFLKVDGKPVSLSGLSVASDPGLWFKYTGTLVVVLGIATMFYMRAYFFRASHQVVACAPAASLAP